MNYWSKMTMCMCLMHVFFTIDVFSESMTITLLTTTTTTKQKQLVIIIVIIIVTGCLYKIFIVNPQKSCTMSIQKIIANKSMGDGVSLLHA